MCDTLEQTIEIAKKSAKKGDIVLFSPASASFDMFKNFADRGNQFKDLVNKIQFNKKIKETIQNKLLNKFLTKTKPSSYDI